MRDDLALDDAGGEFCAKWHRMGLLEPGPDTLSIAVADVSSLDSLVSRVRSLGYSEADWSVGDALAFVVPTDIAPDAAYVVMYPRGPELAGTNLFAGDEVEPCVTPSGGLVRIEISAY